MQVNGQDPGGLDFGDPELNSTEADIMGGFEDDPQLDATQVEEAPQVDDEQPEPDAENKDDVSTSADDNAQLAEQLEPQQAPQHPHRPDADKDGNLIDKDGKVIATAGRERRIFEQNERLKRHASNIEQENTKLRQAAEKINEISGMPSQHGLQPNEVQMGMQIMGEFKKNPISVAQWALKETLGMGYNLKQIIGDADAPDNVQMQAIAKMIDDRVGPVVQQTQQQTQQDQAMHAAKQQYDAFMAKHENAHVHEEALAQIMDRDKTLTPETAYWRLREYATRHALDFGAPLGPQLNARRAQPAPAAVAPVQQQAPQVQQPAMTAPMPVGGSPAATLHSQEQTFADPNSDWEDIIAGSMRAAGMA